MGNFVVRSIALCVTGIMLAATAAYAAPAPMPTAPTTGRGPTTRPHISPNTVIVFPFENNAMTGGRELAEALAAAVKAGIAQTNGYSVATFYPASPLLQRARSEQSLSREEIEGVVDPTRGTVDPTRAASVALRMGGRYALLGSIEAVDVEQAANRANVTVTVQMVDTVSGTPTRTAGVTGTFTGQQGATQDSLVQGAARDAAQRALTELGMHPAASATPVPVQGGVDISQPVQKKKGTSSYWLPLGVVLGILVAGVK
jgi:hypothetical protein